MFLCASLTGAMVAIEGVPLHLPLFAKLWYEIYQSEVRIFSNYMFRNYINNKISWLVPVPSPYQLFSVPIGHSDLCGKAAQRTQTKIICQKKNHNFIQSWIKNAIIYSSFENSLIFFLQVFESSGSHRSFCSIIRRKTLVRMEFCQSWTTDWCNWHRLLYLHFLFCLFCFQIKSHHSIYIPYKCNVK